jgi:hypothetical protein
MGVHGRTRHYPIYRINRTNKDNGGWGFADNHIDFIEHITYNICMITATCLWCKKQFQVRQDRIKSRKFCGQACHYASRNVDVSLICTNCGIEYKVNRANSERRIKKGYLPFCSRKCSDDYRRHGGVQNGHGYLIVGHKDHPLASGSGTVLEHWLTVYNNSSNPSAIVELKKFGWTVHHRNGIRDDNKLGNLELRAPGNHPHGWSIQEMVSILRKLGWKLTPPKSGEDYA